MPDVCDVCHSKDVVLTTREVLGIRRNYTGWEWPVIWFCIDCGAAVGTHQGTETPLGKMAHSNVRMLRIVAHRAFDPIWKRGFMSRDEAYQWMHEKLNIPENAHIGTIGELDLIKLTELSNQYIRERIAKALRNRERLAVTHQQKIETTLFNRQRKNQK